MVNKVTKSAFLAATVLLVTIILWPEKNKVSISEEVESAINSIESPPAMIPEDDNEKYHYIALGRWSTTQIKCAFPRSECDYVSWRNLRSKESVIERR